ncbi:MAG: helix-turn-helix domain-containing protein [Gemmatimonadota bacterium]|nr:helix-turn-helix domain-containing protein [Gemmatimonadota bacterium]
MDGTAVLSDLLTTDQVAQKLGIAAQTLQNWRATGRYAGQLPHVKIGGAVRYRSEDVERVRQEGITRPSTAA